MSNEVISVERNIRRFLPFQALTAVYAWMPIFFLYFSSHLTLAQVLLLEGVYYAAVVILEVPSGYFSDRLGRVRTLRFSSGLLLLAYVLFIVSSSFAGFALAQAVLAAGLAFHSGTDTSFHYDSLESVGKADEYGEREARITSWLLATGALAAIAGGLLSLVDFRLAYALSGIGALCAFIIAWTFIEPPEGDSDVPVPPHHIRAVLARSAGYARSPSLRWVIGFFVAATAINHIPYEFYQPYLVEVLGGGSGDALDLPAPAVAGIHMAAASLVAVPFGALSQRLSDKYGIVIWLMSSLLLQCALIALMWLWLHPLVVLLLIGRSIPSAMQKAPIRSLVTPRILRGDRATFLSLMSLTGRLLFAGLLVALAGAQGLLKAPTDGLHTALMICSIFAGSICAVFAISQTRLGPVTEKEP